MHIVYSTILLCTSIRSTVYKYTLYIVQCRCYMVFLCNIGNKNTYSKYTNIHIPVYIYHIRCIFLSHYTHIFIIDIHYIVIYVYIRICYILIRNNKIRYLYRELELVSRLLVRMLFHIRTYIKPKSW